MKNRFRILTVAGCFMLMFYGVGMAMNLISMFIAPMVTEYGFTQIQVSNIMTLQSVISIFGMAFVGNVYSRQSARKAIVFYSGMIVLSFILFSFGGKGIFVCYLGAISLGLGISGGGSVPVSIIITNWFVKDRGTVLGICLMGSGFASLVWSPIIATIIVNIGLQRAFLIHGGVIMILSIMVILFVRGTPSERNLTPYGAEKADDIAENSEDPSIAEYGPMLSEAIRTKQYIMLTAVMLLLGMVITPMNSYFPSFIQSMGHSTVFAGTASSVFGGTMIAGKLITGRILDKFPRKWANSYLFLLVVIAMLMAFIVSGDKITVIFFVVIYGLCNPIATVPAPIWISDIFGTRDFKQIYSKILLGYSVGTVIGYQIISKIVKATGNYLPVFALFAAAAIFALCLIQSVYKSQVKQQGGEK